MLALVVCRLLSQVERRGDPVAFIVTEGIFIALRVSRLSRLSNRKFSWSWQMLRGGRGGGGGDHVQKIERFYCQNFTFFIQKLIGPLQQTGNPGDRKFDKKLLKFSFFVLFTLFTSCHFQTVFFLTIV